MSQVQNNMLSGFIQPITLGAIAYLAGGQRYITYFPGASRGGLCLATALGTSLVWANKTWINTDESRQDLSSYVHTATLLSLGSCIAYGCSKYLQRHLSLSLQATGRWIVIEGLATALFAGISFFITPQVSPTDAAKDSSAHLVKDLSSWHHRYAVTHPQEWSDLSKKERSQYAIQFFEHHLYAFNGNESIDGNLFPLPPEDLSSVPLCQLEWYYILSKSGQLNISESRQEEINNYIEWRLQEIGELEYVKNTGRISFKHGQYVKSPLSFWILDQTLIDQYTQLFNHAKLPPIPSLKDTLIQLTPTTSINMFGEEEKIVQIIYNYFTRSDTDLCFNQDLNPNQQFEYNHLFQNHDLTPITIDPLTAEYVALLKYPREIAAVRQDYPPGSIAFENTTPAVQHALNDAYIKQAQRALGFIIDGTIMQFNGDSIIF